MLILHKRKTICFCWLPFKYYTQKHLKTQCFLHVFLYMYLKTVKNLQFLPLLYDLGIASKRKKLYQLLFDLFPYNSKKTSSFPKFQNSKNIWGDKPRLAIFGILENSRFFWNFGRKPQKPLCFFGICYEIQKKPCVFWCFGIKFQKNLEFSKIPKFQKKLSTCPNIFGILEFWKTRGFLEFWKIKKKPKVVLKFW